jgi:hypothetical protein
LQLTLELEAAGRSPVGQKYDVRNNIRNCEPQEFFFLKKWRSKLMVKRFTSGGKTFSAARRGTEKPP